MSQPNGIIIPDNTNKLFLSIFRKENWVMEVEVEISLEPDDSPNDIYTTWCGLYPTFNVWGTWDHNGVFGGNQNW